MTPDGKASVYRCCRAVTTFDLVDGLKYSPIHFSAYRSNCFLLGDNRQHGLGPISHSSCHASNPVIRKTRLALSRPAQRTANEGRNSRQKCELSTGDGRSLGFVVEASGSTIPFSCFGTISSLISRALSHIAAHRTEDSCPYVTRQPTGSRRQIVVITAVPSLGFPSCPVRWAVIC